MSHPTTNLIRGCALGGWCGATVALVAALLQGHSPLHFLLNAGQTALPLAGIGLLMGWLSTTRPSPEERIRDLVARHGNELSPDDMQALLRQTAR